MTPAPGQLDSLQRRTLMKVLDQVPDTLEDLTITITRTDSMAPEALGSSGHKVRSVPYNQRASDARVALEKALRVYALRVAIVVRESAPHSPAAQAAFLARHLPGIRNDAPSIHDIYLSVVGASDKARRAIDRPVERVYVGKCECGTGLYAAKEGRETVHCKSCRTPHDIAARRDSMMEQARDMVATPLELARVLPWFLGKPIKAGTIRKWAERGKLKGVQMDGHTMYFIGDVLDLHREANDAAEAA